MKIIERLAEYIESKNISFNAFDISIGASNGYIGKQIKNKASIGGDVIEKIACIYTDISLDWLITGKGEMIRNKSNYNTSHNIASEPGQDYECQLCEEKEKRIDALERIIRTQGSLIDTLQEKSGSSKSGQKRKAG